MEVSLDGAWTSRALRRGSGRGDRLRDREPRRPACAAGGAFVRRCGGDSGGAEPERGVGRRSAEPPSFGTDGVEKLSPRPLLLIHGEADEVLPFACSQDIYRRAREPKELILYPGCRHGLDRCSSKIWIGTRWVGFGGSCKVEVTACSDREGNGWIDGRRPGQRSRGRVRKKADLRRAGPLTGQIYELDARYLSVSEDGVWVFDDEAVGLREEPFVMGIPEMIEDVVGGMCGAHQGFALFFRLAVPGVADQARLGTRRVWRQLVPAQRDGAGRMAVPGTAEVFRRCPGDDLCEGGIAVRSWFSFHGSLRDHAAGSTRVKDFAVSGSVKDFIESFGVPHPEVDWMSVNGEAVLFSYLVRDGNRISVYPRGFCVGEQFPVRPRLMEVRFVLDVRWESLRPICGCSVSIRRTGTATAIRNWCGFRRGNSACC